MKYMVMECHPAYAVVLSEDGRFLKAANLHYEVGQSVSQIIEMELPQPMHTKQTAPRWVPVLASMAACLTLVISGFFLNFVPCASVYMTINPQVRIDVSRTDRVVEVTGVNADGSELVAGYAPQRKELNQVMDELVDRAIDMGYLHEGGAITLSLDANDKWVQTHSQSLDQELNRHLVDKMSVTIDITPATQPSETPSTAATAATQAPAAPPQAQTSYGISAYGDIDEGDSAYEDLSDDGDSSYADSRQDGQTDYEPTEADSSYGAAEKDSGYEAPEKDSDDVSSEKDSGYEAPEKDTGYEAPEKDTGYEAPEKDSGYDPPKTDSGSKPSTKDSDYDPPEKDSGYDPPKKDSGSKPSKKDSGYDPPEKDSGYDDSSYDD